MRSLGNEEARGKRQEVRGKGVLIGAMVEEARGHSLQGFKNLLVWKRAKDLAVQIYKVSETGKIGKDFGLRDQLRRSAISVPSNLAEGDERNTDKESIRFFILQRALLQNYALKFR
jgi:hypothetical protein